MLRKALPAWLGPQTILLLVILFSVLLPVSSQSPSPSLSLTTSTSIFTTTTRPPNANVRTTTVTSLTTFSATVSQSTTSQSTSTSATPSATPSPAPIVLATVVDPAFGVLGALLILTGLPSAFWGHKNRWSSLFLIGFYTLGLVCFVLITNFGILPAINPPSKTLRGLFVLASVVAGIAGGAIAIFFWKAAQYFIGAWGGFAFALFLQCLQNGGLVKTIGIRWIFYIACAAVGFVLCTLPKIHYHILLISTSFVGASAVMLGVDCYTTAGLKEFYVWNLGFRSLFPKFTRNNIQFPVSQTMQIELGLLAAIALMGIAVQLRILVVLQRKLKEIKFEQKKRDEEANMEHTERFTAVDKEREQWEREHPTLPKHGRHESGLSSVPLMKYQDGSESPTLSNDPRPRYQSGVSDFLAATTPDEEVKRYVRNQSPGALPTLDLGLGIEDDVPKTFMAEDDRPKDLSDAEKGLLDEIQTIRRSIELLKSDSPTPPTPMSSRRPSETSRRALSMDATSSLSPPAPSHLRPPRMNPRERTQSMELSTLASASAAGDSISRPTSVPLRDNDWDAYLHDRKLIQPPSGVSPPIPVTPANVVQKLSMPPAVSEAINKRRARESVLLDREGSGSSSSDIPLAALSPGKTDRKKASVAEKSSPPVTILPPRKVVAPTPRAPETNRTRTYEELAERHREKMRGLQGPVTQHVKEEADLVAAKERWERSKLLEKAAVEKRQNEKAEMLEKKRRQELSKDDKRRSSAMLEPEPRPSGHAHSRSLSADKLATLGGSSKRLSTLKVQDWQRYQEETGEMGQNTSRRDSRNPTRPPNVPFPGKDVRGSTTERRR